MKQKHTLRLAFSAKPIRQPITKMGGQPVWLEAPQWPISPYFQEPMLFLGQVALDPALFGGAPGRLAYIFITDPDAIGTLTLRESRNAGFWAEPFDGENAVIIQPGGRFLKDDLRVLPLATGPGLSRQRRGKRGRGVPERVELRAHLIASEDPDYTAPEDTTDEQLAENKVGGTPALQADLDYPMLADWPLLVQLNLGNLPFDLGLEPFWVLHGLLSPDGTTGAITVQDPYANSFPPLPEPAEAEAAENTTHPASEPETWAVEEADDDDEAAAKPTRTARE